MIKKNNESGQPEYNFPPKARRGSPCNQCGRCCANVICSLGLLAHPEAVAPCPELGYSAHTKKFGCRLVEIEQSVLPQDMWFCTQALGIGKGCDCLDEYEKAGNGPVSSDNLDDQSFINGSGSAGDSNGAVEGKSNPKEPKELDPDKLKKAIVLVSIFERPAQLILNRRPSESGKAWMKYEDDGEEFEGILDQCKLVQIIEG